jgi:hypothetical protein
MAASETIEVFPIYGWGWVIAGSPRFEVPAPFKVKLEHAEAARWSASFSTAGMSSRANE